MDEVDDKYAHLRLKLQVAEARGTYDAHVGCYHLRIALDDLACLRSEVARLSAENAELRKSIEEDGVTLSAQNLEVNRLTERLWLAESVCEADAHFEDVNAKCPGEYTWEEWQVAAEASKAALAAWRRGPAKGEE